MDHMCVLLGLPNIPLAQHVQFPLTWNSRPRPAFKRGNGGIEVMTVEHSLVQISKPMVHNKGLPKAPNNRETGRASCTAPWFFSEPFLVLSPQQNARSFRGLLGILAGVTNPSEVCAVSRVLTGTLNVVLLSLWWEWPSAMTYLSPWN